MSDEERQATGSNNRRDSRFPGQPPALPRLVVPDPNSSAATNYLISPPPWSTARTRPTQPSTSSTLISTASAGAAGKHQHQAGHISSTGHYIPHQPGFSGSVAPSSSTHAMQAASLPPGPTLRAGGPSQGYPASLPRPHIMVPPLSPTLFSAPGFPQVLPALGSFPFPTPRSVSGGSTIFGMSPHGGPPGGFFTPTAPPPHLWFGQPPQPNSSAGHQPPPRMAPAISPHNSMYQLIGSSGSILSMPSPSPQEMSRRAEHISRASALIKRSSSSSVDEPRASATGHSPSASRTSSLSSMVIDNSPPLEARTYGEVTGSPQARKRSRLARHATSTSGEGDAVDDASAMSSTANDSAMFDFNGEGRLAIDFVSEGRLSVLPPPFIGRKSVVPDGISGHFTSYGERWQFLVRYSKMHEVVQGEAKRQVVAVEWLIRNNAWTDYVSLAETLRDALRREDRGVTLCNRAFTLALDKRAGEYETALSAELAKPTPNQLRVANLSSRIKTLRPKRTSEGPLLFGLRHRSIQERFISVIESASGASTSSQRVASGARQATAKATGTEAPPVPNMTSSVEDAAACTRAAGAAKTEGPSQQNS